MIKDLDQWDLDQWDLDQWELMKSPRPCGA